MDCTFRILTKDNKTFEKLIKLADAYSNKGLIIINAKCDSLDFLKKFDVEMLITPSDIENKDCFYFDGDLKECNEEIIAKFDSARYEPLIWKEPNNQNTPF